MLTRSLLRDAIRLMGDETTGEFRVRFMTPATIQRRVRVGFATAAQLAEALETAGVLGAVGLSGRRRVDAPDAPDVPAAHALVDEAIEDGRVKPDPEDQRQHWPSCTKFDRPVDGHELDCGCWCHRQAATGNAPDPGGEA